MLTVHLWVTPAIKMTRDLPYPIVPRAALLAITLAFFAACDNAPVSPGSPGATPADRSSTQKLVRTEYAGLITLQRERIGPTHALHIGLDEDGDGVAERLFTIQQQTEEQIAALAKDGAPFEGTVTVFEQPAPEGLIPMPRGLRIQRGDQVFAFAIERDEVASLPHASMAVGLAQGLGSWEIEEERLFVPPVAGFVTEGGNGEKPLACSGGEGSASCHTTCESGGCGIACKDGFYSNCCCSLFPSCYCTPES